MFTHRIRKPVLALAGATLLATALTTTTAAAPATTAGLERAEHTRQIKLPDKFPHADLGVTSLGFTADATIQNVEYRFRITNNGPVTMTFKYQGKAYWAKDGHYNGTQDGPVGHATRNPGESIDVVLNCTLSGDPSHYCQKGVMTVTPVFGFDKNAANNTTTIQSGPVVI